MPGRPGGGPGENGGGEPGGGPGGVPADEPVFVGFGFALTPNNSQSQVLSTPQL